MTIARFDAINLLVGVELPLLTSEKRASLLLSSWWCLDNTDAEFNELPSDIQEAIRTQEAPIHPHDVKFDDMLRVTLRKRYKGVNNSYLSAMLVEATGVSADVVGLQEQLCPCPCCGYKTLDERGQYYICPVCFWEDDGSVALDVYSHANKSTLGEAQAEYARIGAYQEQFLTAVNPKGPLKYARV